MAFIIFFFRHCCFCKSFRMQDLLNNVAVLAAVALVGYDHVMLQCFSNIAKLGKWRNGGNFNHPYTIELMTFISRLIMKTNPGYSPITFAFSVFFFGTGLRYSQREMRLYHLTEVIETYFKISHTEAAVMAANVTYVIIRLVHSSRRLTCWFCMRSRVWQYKVCWSAQAEVSRKLTSSL